MKARSTWCQSRIPIPPDATRTLSPKTFGEAAVNLTDSSIFPAGRCTSFGSGYLKSRSSDSFTAAIKDFVAPFGEREQLRRDHYSEGHLTEPGYDGHHLQLHGDGRPHPRRLRPQERRETGLRRRGPSRDLQRGRGGPGPTFALQGIDCSASSLTQGSTATTDTATRKVDIVLKAGDTVDCTFTNNLQQGAIKITKTSTKGNAALAGATFEIKQGTTVKGTVTSDANGVACLGGLGFGNYTVTETAAPTGYNIDDATAHAVTVNQVATCAAGSTGQAPTSFTDTPLSKIQVVFTSLAGPGA